MIERLTGTLPDASIKYIISDTAPTADDQDKLWIKTAAGAPIRQFIFYDGAWVWPHEIPAEDSRIQIYKGTAASVDTLDGGVAGVANAASGPFWEIDPDLSARLPVGVGTLDSGTSVAVGDTGGSAEHTLVQTELPDHSHTLTLSRYSLSNSSNPPPNQLLASNIAPTTPDTPLPTPDVSIDGGGSDEAHNNMPPYYGVYFIKRTKRKYYTG